ncbi:MAG TPA: Hsp20/alpha crystallin family protein [Pyrinomonadaceae bacterium]|nr:Hsp20/alpha crystallin family protein [Pyrinomonadaceae bacterium]
MAKQNNTTKKKNGNNQPITLQHTKEDLEELAAKPIALMRRFSEEMDNLFADFGLGRGWGAPIEKGTNLAQGLWSPQVEVFERGQDIVVRADLPGLTKDDVNVEVADNGITIEGERKQEKDEKGEGYYRSERAYGKFYRRLPLPDGVKADDAQATFSNGVLEITMPASKPEQRKSRRLQIAGEGRQQAKGHAA